MVGTAFFAPFQALLTPKILRRNRRVAPLAYTQLMCGIALLILVP